MVDLPHGGQFSERDLVGHIRASGRDYIIQGQQTATLANHTKPHSLNYRLRQFAKNENTKQSENSVLESLVGTGVFVVENNQ